MKTQTIYGYENLRYELLAFWHFCVEVAPTTWQQALAETVHHTELAKGKRAALYWQRLTPAQRREVRSKLASDIKASEQQGVKYRAPRGHGTAIVLT